MHILTVNTGSASVKLTLFTAGEDAPALLRSRRIETGSVSVEAELREFLAADQVSVQAVAHRIVHGGCRFTAPCRLDDDALSALGELSVLAPLHNPVALRWIRATQQTLGRRVPQVGVFDTAFFAELPGRARDYALPRTLAERLGIRRYGFHGLAHRAMWRRWCALRPDLEGGGRLISLQLGGGCSITATERGRPQDTSMGFSPAEGLVMATRCGELDPTLGLYIHEHAGLAPREVERLLNEQSGLLGFSGRSADMGTLVQTNDPASREAVALYCYRIRKYIGAYLAVLGGVDGVVFGGGVGEHSPAVRAQVLAGMEWCGLDLDAAANAEAVGGEGRISPATADTEIWTLGVDEAQILAEEAATLLEL